MASGSTSGASKWRARRLARVDHTCSQHDFWRLAREARMTLRALLWTRARRRAHRLLAPVRGAF